MSGDNGTAMEDGLGWVVVVFPWLGWFEAQAIQRRGATRIYGRVGKENTTNLVWKNNNDKRRIEMQQLNVGL